MNNILNNVTAKSKTILTTEDTVTISFGDNRYFARVNENNEYTILNFSNPVRTISFENESEFLAHLEGDSTVGKSKHNPSHWNY
tara:strand:- start:3366 stop:3617 length:252 start_codon:yes stop_codon:yes gene_type:complete